MHMTDYIIVISILILGCCFYVLWRNRGTIMKKISTQLENKEIEQV